MTKLIVATGFVVAFCAGVMVGLIARHPGHGPNGGPSGGQGPGGRASWIADQLGLSTDQQAKMKEIWEGVSHRGGHDWGARRSQIRHDQEEAVGKLVRPEDRAAYDAVVKESRDKLDAMDGEGRRAYQQAVEKTKQVLTAEQLQKYELLLAKSAEGRGATRPTENAAEHSRPASR